MVTCFAFHLLPNLGKAPPRLLLLATEWGQDSPPADVDWRRQGGWILGRAGRPFHMQPHKSKTAIIIVQRKHLFLHPPGSSTDCGLNSLFCVFSMSWGSTVLRGWIGARLSAMITRVAALIDAGVKSMWLGLSAAFYRVARRLAATKWVSTALARRWPGMIS